MATCLELGDIAVSAHESIGKSAKDNNVDILFTYGELSKNTARTAIDSGVSGLYFDSHDALAEKLYSILRSNDGVLVKGSRGMKLENVLNKLYDLLGE